MTGPAAYRTRKQPLPSSSKPAAGRAPRKKPTVVLVPPVPEPVKQKGIVVDDYVIPTYTAKELAQAATLQKECSEPASMLQNFGYAFKEHTRMYLRKGAACYASLGLPAETGTPIFFADWATKNYNYPAKSACYTPYVADGPLDVKLAVEWCDWAANHSLWKNVFITKDPEEMLTKASLYHTHYPLRFLIGGAQLLRYVYEHADNIRTWFALKDHINPNVAVFLSHFVKVDKAGVASKITTWGHAIFDSLSTLDEQRILTSLYNADFTYVKKQKPCAQSPWGYRTLASIWSPERDTGCRPKLVFPPHDDGSYNPAFGGGDTRTWKDVAAFCKGLLALNLKE